MTWDSSTLLLSNTPRSPQESLQVAAPQLVREWSDRNAPVRPDSVFARSTKKAWWTCPAGHEWFATIRDRVRKSAGCPFCAGKRVSATNSIAAVSPRAATLWHPTRNLPATPSTVVPGSNKKVWWQCDAGHEWLAPPNHVALKGSGCHRCVDARDSKREQQCHGDVDLSTYIPSVLQLLEVRG
jgi:hypothetical protein